MISDHKSVAKISVQGKKTIIFSQLSCILFYFSKFGAGVGVGSLDVVVGFRYEIL